MSKPANIGNLIAAHIHAVATYEGKFSLNDWGLSESDETVSEALATADRALIEICKARPTDREDIELRRSYLSAKVPPTIDGIKGGITQEIIDALIGGAS